MVRSVRQAAERETWGEGPSRAQDGGQDDAALLVPVVQRVAGVGVAARRQCLDGHADRQDPCTCQVPEVFAFVAADLRLDALADLDAQLMRLEAGARLLVPVDRGISVEQAGAACVPDSVDPSDHGDRVNTDFGYLRLNFFRSSCWPWVTSPPFANSGARRPAAHL